MIKPIKEDMIPIPQKRNKNLKELEAFIKTGAKAGEVDLGEQTLASKAACLRVAIRRHNLPLKQVQRQNKLYVLRTDI